MYVYIYIYIYIYNIKNIDTEFKTNRVKQKTHTCKQGHYGDIVPKLPMRSMLVGPSGSGETVLLTNMILDIYKGCFSRIYIWSPSIEVDNTWKPVNKLYQRPYQAKRTREMIF